WYTVLAPEQFDRAELGETPADEPEQLIDRTIQATIGDLREDVGEDNMVLTFRITDVGSDTAHTEFVRHELTRDYVRSLVRRGSSKVAAVLTVRTADDYRVEVQPVAFTTKRADHSQKKAVRETMVGIVEDAAEERTLEEFLDSVVGGQLSAAIYGDAKTIYPLRRVEISKTVVEASPEEVREEEATAVDVDEDATDVDL
ncbi:MAG: 30S ribosomal protein S3ae, partial [Halobacteriaceae archaeon]